MSRLYDRVLAYGCRAFRPSDLELRSRAEVLAGRRALIEQQSPELSEAAVERVLENFWAHEPQAVERFDPAELDGATVIAADEVAAYCGQLPRPLDMADLVSAIAPPFERFFVEFQGVPNPRGMHAWGVLFSELEPDEFGWDDKDASRVGWEMRLTVIIEPAKGGPAGPVSSYFMAVGRDGLWLRHADGGPVLAGNLVKLDPSPPPELVKESLDQLVDLVFPALMTVSFMHCRNVVVSETESPAPLSRRWEKRRGRPLVRYRVLDIAPMREILDREGEVQAKGLRHALHICRGHFKTYTADSPLFGRHTGRYWWASRVRGSAEEGRVVKDYAVELDEGGLGRAYRDADEAPELSYAQRAHPDPDTAGRGLAAHNRIQNTLAEAARAAGHTPRRPSPDEPNYDLAWEANGVTWVTEAKSITTENEERQLRLALGQVSRYRHQLARDGREVRAVIAVESEPHDRSWVDLCQEQNIALIWPETMKSRLFMQPS